MTDGDGRAGTRAYTRQYETLLKGPSVDYRPTIADHKNVGETGALP